MPRNKSGSSNGGVIGVTNNASFGKCTVTSKTSSGNITTQPGTRLVTTVVVAGGGGGASADGEDANGNYNGGNGGNGLSSSITGSAVTRGGGGGGCGNNAFTSQTGGSGFVAIRYKFQ